MQWTWLSGCSFIQFAGGTKHKWSKRANQISHRKIQEIITRNWKLQRSIMKVLWLKYENVNDGDYKNMIANL